MKKVLVVDDSKTIRTICECIYKSLEDRVLTADSAASARQMIQSESPDIVVVDYTLPDMDAYEFVASIKDMAKVVMMGGTYADFDDDKALNCGAVATLMKPFKTADFFATMDEAMTAVSSDVPAAAPAVETPSAIESVIPMPSMPSAPAMPAVPMEAPQPAPSSPSNPRIGIPSSAPSPIGAHNMAPSVAPIGAHNMAPSIAPISAHVAHSSDGVPPISSHAAPLGAKPISGIQPAAAPRRFNFPGSNSGIMEAPKATDGGTPPAKVDSVVAPMPTASTSSEMPAASRPLDRSTPKTPVPSISPAVQAAAAQAPAAPAPAPAPETANVQIDPAVLRAEVIAAVKSMLPAIVNSYLKKLIQAEVKPQLQHWVDARVEALVKKMMQQ